MTNFFETSAIEVYEGRVLLTGRVATEDMRAEAVKLAWSVDSTKDVINELLVRREPPQRYGQRQLDYRQADLKKSPLMRKYFPSTIRSKPWAGVIYLIGIAQDQAELDRVINHARSIDSVQRGGQPCARQSAQSVLITRNDIVRELTAYGAGQRSSLTLAEVAVRIGALERPALPLDRYTRHLQSLADKVGTYARTNDGAVPVAVMAEALCQVLARHMGYGGGETGWQRRRLF